MPVKHLAPCWHRVHAQEMWAASITCLVNAWGREEGRRGGGARHWQQKKEGRGECSYPISSSHLASAGRQMPFTLCFRNNPSLAAFLRVAVLQASKWDIELNISAHCQGQGSVLTAPGTEQNRGSWREEHPPLLTHGSQGLWGLRECGQALWRAYSVLGPAVPGSEEGTERAWPPQREARVPDKIVLLR